METTSTSTFRAVIVHEDGKFGHSYCTTRETADEAFADLDRFVSIVPGWNLSHKVEVVVQQTTTAVTVIDALTSATVTTSAVIVR
jgi:hypothetical protein